MGRILVIFFLTAIVLGFVGAAFAADAVFRFLWHVAAVYIPSSPIQPPPHQPPLFQWGGPVYHIVVDFFGLAVPAAVLLQLAADMLLPRPKSNWRYPPPIDLRQERVAAVLTAYNDAESIGLAVDEFKAHPEIGTVVVIDNNCVDRTAAVAREHGAVVIEEKQQGYGHACMAGLRYALEHTNAPAIVLAEGDMTFYGDDIQKLLPYLHDCDMVVGTRTTWALTKPDSQLDWFLTWGNLFLALLIRLRFWNWRFLGRVQLTDAGCTFRAIRRDALERILDQLTDGGNSFSPHMIIAALREGFWVVEAPVKFRKRVGLSKGAGKNRSRATRIGLGMILQIAFY